jgi:hypothetical protein
LPGPGSSKDDEMDDEKAIILLVVEVPGSIYLFTGRKI